MNNNLACCIFTYNHPDVIGVTVRNMHERYDEHGIDIYIYDSSEGNETKAVIDRLIEGGATNLYYVDARAYGGDEKVVCMLKKMGLKKEYDYIWNSKDRCYFIGKALDDIVEATKEGHDIIFGVDETERWEMLMPAVMDVYTDPVLFYSHYGQLATNWECLIRKTKTMLDGYDLDAFIEKYKLGNENPFNQPVSAFARLAELDSCSIKVIHDAGDNRVYDLSVGCGWVNKLYKIWIEKWIAANESLPDIYNEYKDIVIKLETNLPQLFGSNDRFMYFKDGGLYTPEIFEHYKEIWPRVTNLPVKYLEYIAYGRMEELVAEVLDAFDLAFLNQEYDNAYSIFKENKWMKMVYGDDAFADMEIIFEVYKSERNKKGESVLFRGVKSMEELFDRYYSIRNK